MAGNESPFEHVPASSRTEPSSGYTFEGQLERVGEFGTGLQSRSSGARLAVRIILGVMLAAFLLAALVPLLVMAFRAVVS